MKEKRFELRSGDKKWAILSSSNRGYILEHHLTEFEVTMCPGIVVHDDKDEILSLKLGDELFLHSSRGGIQLKLQHDGFNVTDVIDPRREVGLVVNLVGPGSTGDAPITHGDYVLGLRWLAT
jgi:hypothetical protein